MTTGRIRGLRSIDDSLCGTWIAPYSIEGRMWQRIEGAVGRVLSDQERQRLSRTIAVFRFRKELPETPSKDVKNTLRRMEQAPTADEVLLLADQCDSRTRAYVRDALFLDIECQPVNAERRGVQVESWLVMRPAHTVPLLCDRAGLLRIAASVALRTFQTAGHRGGRPVKGAQLCFAEECLDIWETLTNEPPSISHKDGGASRYSQFFGIMLELFGDRLSPSRMEQLALAARSARESK